MTRLIDDLRARTCRLCMPFVVTKRADWERQATQLRQLLSNPQLPVFDVDAIADYYYTCEQEHWDLKTDFPHLIPPTPAFWCEHKLVRRIHSAEKGDTDLSHLVPRGGRVGALIHALDPGQVRFGGAAPAEVRWIYWCELYVDYGRPGITADGPHGSMFVAVDAAGTIVDRPWMQTLDNGAHARHCQQLITFLYPSLLHVSFLEAKCK